MLSVGEKLQRARLERGLDLASVASLTKINPKYLQAIEADDRARLPSAFFYKSFVHQYASVLSLDTRQLDAEIDPVLSAEAPPPLPGQETREARSLPRLKSRGYRFYKQSQYASYAGLVIVLLGCSGIYSWWHRTQTSAPVQVQQAKAQPTVVTPPPAAPHGMEVIPGYKVLLELLAREETWLSVSSDGRTVFSGILAPNESKSVEGREFAKLKVGNAAGLEVRLNGKLISPLGGRGQVLVVVFHPDNFQIVPQTPREGD
jgi:transcriptional regulator with XRE-family HTH domain